MNKIGFSVHSRFQGRQEITARIFLWPSTAKIVISDIDGTITKSDALGHIMPLFGNDWSQPGIVKLLTQISSNGYQIVYLSARSIVQAGTTRNYLEMIRQSLFYDTYIDPFHELKFFCWNFFIILMIFS